MCTKLTSRYLKLMWASSWRGKCIYIFAGHCMDSEWRSRAVSVTKALSNVCLFLCFVSASNCHADLAWLVLSSL